MNWKEYVRVCETFRAQFGVLPPSMITSEGMVRYMKEALERRDDRDRKDTRETPGVPPAKDKRPPS